MMMIDDSCRSGCRYPLRFHADEGLIHGKKVEDIKEEAPEVALGAPEQVEEEEQVVEDERKMEEMLGTSHNVEVLARDQWVSSLWDAMGSRRGEQECGRRHHIQGRSTCPISRL